jgi:hypothetical protein
MRHFNVYVKNDDGKRVCYEAGLPTLKAAKNSEQAVHNNPYAEEVATCIVEVKLPPARLWRKVKRAP